MYRFISEHHRASVVAMRGETGAAWLARIPGLVEEYAARWGLDIAGPLGTAWFNLALAARRADGTPVVLKLCPPDEREFSTQAAALRHFDGRGSVRLLAAEHADGAMLLEGLQPGTPLSTREEDTQLQAAADVMRQLWRPAPSAHSFPTVSYWATGIQRLLRDRFEGTTGPLPEDLVVRAEEVFAELLVSQAEPVLLHGDLHAENILAAQRAPWLAIDPKGVVGEPAYEPGALLRNNVPRENARSVLQRRIDVLAEVLELDRQRLRLWGFAQAVLSAVWSVDDGQDPRALVTAEALR